MKKHIHFLLIAFLFAACQPPVDTAFEHEGVSFTIPAGWYISEQETNEGGGYGLSVEKKGLDASALFNVSWFADTVDQAFLMSFYQESLRDNGITEFADLSFSDLEKTSF